MQEEPLWLLHHFHHLQQARFSGLLYGELTDL